MALPSKAAEVTGRVVDVRRDALAGARIVLSRGDRVIAETTTGADGAFSFAPVPADDELPLIVAAEAPRMVRRTDWWRAGGGPIELVLHPAVALRGRVVDEAGAPLRGVEVTARHADRRGDRQSTRTADDGGFLFDAVALGRTTVMAFLDGYQLAVLEHRAGDAGDVEIRLGPANGRAIRFRIVGASPEQLAAASCHLYDTDLELPDSCCRGRPDATGVWQVRGLPSEHTYSSLHVAIPGARCEPRHEWCPAHPKSGCCEFEFTVHPIVTRHLRGRVRRDDGTPFAGIELRARSNFSPDATVVTDAAGRFAAPTEANDDDIVAFEVTAPDFVFDGPGLPEFVSQRARDLHRVRLPCDDEIVLTAVRAASIRVSATHPDGSPAAAAFVSVEIAWRSVSGDVTSQLANGVTDGRGVVQCFGLHPQPGAVVFARVKGDGWDARSADVRLIAGDVVELRVVAPATGVVTGVARDATGRLLAGEPVAVYRDGAEDPRWPAAEATTDREGLFRFATLAGGAYAFGPSLAERAKWFSAPFSVRAGATLHHDFTARSAAQ